jgi:hypothetical protein
MKRILGTVLVCLMATPAFAGSWSLDGRFDYESVSSNDDSTTLDNTSFQVNRLKLDGIGTLGSAVKYRTRVNLLGLGAATDRDKTSNLVDFAWVGREIGSDWQVNIGKVALGMGGIEAMNNPGDVHLRSVAGDEVAARYWQGGVQFEGKMGKNKLLINYTNPTVDSNDGAEKEQSTMMMGATYIANMGDISLNASYHMEKYSVGAAADFDNKYMAVGVKWANDLWEVEADYLNNDYSDTAVAAQASGFQGLLSGVADTTEGTNSIPVLVRYKFGAGNSVHFKMEQTTSKLATAGDTKRNGMTVAYESKPSKDENWRWHAAYTTNTVDPENGDTAVDTTMFVGMKIHADFLK